MKWILDKTNLATLASLVGLGCAGVSIMTQNTPALSIIGTVVGILGLLIAIATAQTTNRWPVTAIILNISATIGFYLGQHLNNLTQNAKDNTWLQPAEIESIGMLAFYTPCIVGMVVMLVIMTHTKNPDPKSDNPVPAAKKELLDVEIGKAKNNGNSVVLKHMDRYLHTIIVGTTGTGKTSRVLKPMIYQDLLARKQGAKLGITVIEPKGDFAQDVAQMCQDLEIPYLFLNPEDPGTPKFNPLQGDPQVAAEITRTVFQALFGKQEAFFQLNQAIAARNTVLLLKSVKGDNVTLKDMALVLREYQHLRNLVEQLKRKQGGRTSLTDYFEAEVFAMEDKAKQFQLGLRLQIDNMINNPMLERTLCGPSDINLHKHITEGGVLIVNTAMGALGNLGDAFGQFVIMHFQQAIFQRTGTEWTRTPHMLYVDEFPRYVNPDFERLLAIGRSFRCGATLAVQTTAQIQLEEKRAFKETVLETCRNKIIMNLGSAEDAQRFSSELGEYEAVIRQKSYNRDGILLPWMWDGAREEIKEKKRFSYTDLTELPKFHAAIRIVRNGQPLPPVLAKLELSPWDAKRWKQKPRQIDGQLDVAYPPDAEEKSKLKVVFEKPKKQDAPGWFK